MILGFDPGRDKCGIAVKDSKGQLYYHQVVDSESAIATCQTLCQKYPVTQIVMGDRTTSKTWNAQLSEKVKVPVALVDEHNSTMEARDRYWEMYPPKGLTRLLPQGMRVPPRPVDDIVAILLIERYLKR
ncbi:pre-16S rRNA-processing nuclease YqgF [Oscillatoria sp. FACHB-1406]|uniref:pre-16S rRNA-processing nuclease YqgF n=1 Tax=Oscillatoria sp. FACHB-1406 TaxID=2692846 RepID=UPI0016887FBA|nr:pre-16S rRNA-processing nuclease YqgF [Oscillatoria sp. FACHB-1406]MBD2579316.1 pre-16S rRNA-processing nuclease YqgF [Oscillatoria sp. FACHB-1406]